MNEDVNARCIPQSNIAESCMIILILSSTLTNINDEILKFNLRSKNILFMIIFDILTSAFNFGVTS